MPRGGHAFIDLALTPDLAVVGPVRRFAMDFLQRVVGHEELASRAGLVAHELLENAVRYSADGDIRLRIDVQHGIVTIQTRNRACAPQLESLGRSFAEAERAPDADAHYRALLERAARRARESPSHTGGIGLARIRAEADMALDHEVEGDTVLIEARACFAPQETTP